MVFLLLLFGWRLVWFFFCVQCERRYVGLLGLVLVVVFLVSGRLCDFYFGGFVGGLIFFFVLFFGLLWGWW